MARRATPSSLPRASGKLRLDLLECLCQGPGSGRTRCSQEAERASRGSTSNRLATCSPCSARPGRTTLPPQHAPEVGHIPARRQETSVLACRARLAGVTHHWNVQLEKTTPPPIASPCWRRTTPSSSLLGVLRPLPLPQGRMARRLHRAAMGRRSRLLGVTGGAPGKRHSRRSWAVDRARLAAVSPRSARVARRCCRHSRRSRSSRCDRSTAMVGTNGRSLTPSSTLAQA